MFYRAGPATSGQKVYLATPAHQGGITAGYTFSLFHSAVPLHKAGITAELAICSGECHVDDARNHLVRDFLETDCTDLVFLDADVFWQPEDLVELLGYKADVVCGIYPLKKEPEGFPVFQLEGEQRANEQGLLEIAAGPTGFMRIRRHVLEQLYEKSPKFRRPEDSRSKLAEIFKRTLEDGYRWGGDTQFCKRWRELGGTIWAAPEMSFEHYGDRDWNGSLGSYLRRNAGVSMRYCLERIKAGKDTLATHVELTREWNNFPWSAPPEMLLATAGLARRSKKIVEFGTGLTTVVASAATQGDITAFEHHKEWAVKLGALLGENARIEIKEVGGDPPFYRPLYGKYDMAICDGPPRVLAPGRLGLYSALEQVLEPGGFFVIDDLDTSEALEKFLAWAAPRAKHEIVHGSRTFAIGKLNGD